MRTARSGFSLLEVILALTALAVTVGMLSAVSRIALRNAATARDLSRAQLLCESKVAEILAGITPTSPVDNSRFDSSTEAAATDKPAWVYSIDNPPTDEQGLIAVRVTVTQDLPEEQHPVKFTLVRWMVDPNATQTTSGTSSSSSGTSSSSAAGGQNGA